MMLLLYAKGMRSAICADKAFEIINETKIIQREPLTA